MPAAAAGAQPCTAGSDLRPRRRARGQRRPLRHESGRHQERAAPTARLPARLHRGSNARTPMNAAQRTAAEERLLDAALQQLLRATDAAAPPSRLRRAWVAAAVLFGVAVVAGTIVLARQPGTRTAAQDPRPRDIPEPELPSALATATLEELDALPADTPNVACALAAPADLAHLQRFTALRRLEIRKDLVAVTGAGPQPPGSRAAPD